MQSVFHGVNIMAPVPKKKCMEHSKRGLILRMKHIIPFRCDGPQKPDNPPSSRIHEKMISVRIKNGTPGQKIFSYPHEIGRNTPPRGQKV